MTTTTPRLSADALKARFLADEDLFWTLHQVTTWSVDLLDANPDIAEQVARGTMVISTCSFVLDGHTYYYAERADGEEQNYDMGDLLEATMVFADDQQTARKLADSMILEWKRNWGI